jgi:RNA polymerase sigma-70 factor (ECF subfamily)
VSLAAQIAGGRWAAYAPCSMEQQDPDAELVRLAQAGDERAFEALVVKYQRRIAKHVARYVRNASDVEDVVQETFIRAYRGLPSFRGGSAFYTWLYRVASNTAFTFLERRPPLDLLGDQEPDERADAIDLAGSAGEDPERLLMASQIADALQRGLQKLQPALLEALTLYEVEGKSYSEIARMVDIPVGTVRTRIFRAREALAKRLESVLGPYRGRRW